MNVYELLKQLGSSGIKLWLEDNELKFRAPKGALTKQFKEQIKANKPEIIEFLQGTKTGAAAEAEIIRPVDRSLPIPLSFAQQRLWFLDQLVPGDISYNIPIHLLMKGALKVEVFERVFGEVMKRHEVLRTTFSSEGDVPTQIVHAFDGWTLPFYDISQEASDYRAKRLSQLVDGNVAQSFDLQNGPLFRVALIKLSEEEFHLTVTLHHIISDGWSMGVLIQEVVALYQVNCANLESPLTPLQVQYADFSAWQREWLSGEVLQNQCNYWQEKLFQVPKLELPTDKARPAVLQNHGSTIEFDWDAGLLKELNSFSQQQGVTLFMTLLAAFKVILYRYTSQDDFAVGTPIANRSRPELEPIIGFFVNTLALRTDLSGQPSFIELLARVQKTTLDGYTRQDVPFERVVELSGVAREMSHTPLFQVMFVLQNASASEFALPGLHIEDVATERLTSKFDLQLSFSESEQGLKGEIEYCTDLFDRQTMEEFESHFKCLVTGILKNPQLPIDQFDLLTSVEQKKILCDWNNTHTDYPSDKSLLELFGEHVEKNPHKIALAGAQGSLTYRELNIRANQLARELLQQPEFCLSKESAIGICVDRSFEQMISIFAAYKLGLAYVPLDEHYPLDRLTGLLELADIHWVIILSGSESVFDDIECGLVTADEDLSANDVANVGSLKEDPLISKQHPAYIMFTSGSTGQPKGIEVGQQGVVRLVKNTNYFPFEDDQVFILSAAFCFDVSTFEIWGALLNGHCLVIPDPGPLDAQRLKQQIIDHRVTTIWLTAALFHYVVEYEFDLLRPLKYLLAGGDILAPSLAKKVLREIPSLTLINGYGPTENTTFTCCYTMHSVSDVGRTVSIGKPIANCQVYLLDAHLKPVPIGVMGQLYTAGPGVAQQYIKRKDLTEQSFIANPYADFEGHGPRLYATGDYGRYLPSGDIEFLGRMDGQVKIRGFRIELGEIETNLMKLPWVKQCVVVAKTAVDGEKNLVAYWETDAANHDALIEKTKRQLSHSVPDYMLPVAHVILEKLPVNDNGKVNRRALPEADFSGTQSEYLAPCNSTETALVEIWKDLLGVDTISVNDSFFDLGGHSLLATQVASRVRNQWQVDIPLRAFFESATIAALSELIESTQSQEHQSDFRIEKLSVDDVIPASFAQRRLWLLDQLQPGSAAYNVPLAFRIRGELKLDLLEQSVQKIVQRHDALRTVFFQEGSHLNQRVSDSVEFNLQLETLADLNFENDHEKLKFICQSEAAAPFNLADGPLYRFRLLKLNDRDFIGLVTLHHIISDGWSLGVFVHELVKNYEAFESGLTADIADLEIQYGDYAAWQQDWMADERLELHLDFYRQSLAGNDLVLRLPTDRPRPRFASSAGQTIGHTLSAELSQKILLMTQRENVSLYMLMLSVWQIILARYSGQSQFNIGSPVAGRTRQETEVLIGFFINTVVMPANVSGNPSFRTLLHQNRDSVLDTFAHQDLPFEKLVEALKPPRDLSRSPVFQVFLNVLNLPKVSGEMAGLLIEDLMEEEAEYESKFDLTLYAKERAEGIHLSMLYRTDCFDKKTIQNHLSQLETLLNQVVLDIEAPIDTYPLTDAPMVTFESGRPALALDQEVSSLQQPQQLFEQCALSDPAKIAIEDLDGAWSYGDLNAWSNQLAHAITDAGLGKDDCVVIYGHRSGALAWAILGVLKSAAAFVVLDPSLPEHRLVKYLEQVDIKGALCLSRGDACPQSLASIFAQAQFNYNLPGLETIAGDNPCSEFSQHSLSVQREDDALAYISFTSGTSGQAKGIRASLRPLNHFINWYSDQFEVSSDDRFSQLSGLGHDPLLRDFLVPLANHATVFIPEQTHFDEPVKMRHWLLENKISISHLTPSLFRLINIGRDSDEEILESLRLIFFGGESLLLSHVREANSFAPNAQSINCYGATETPQIVAYHPVTEQEINFDETCHDHIMPVGGGAPGSQLVLLGTHNRPIGFGELGEVWVCSDFLALGYTDEGLTGEAFKQGTEAATTPAVRANWYRTGDLGRYRSDGQVEIVGRGDNQIKVRGYRVEILDVQNELRCIDTVRDCFVAADKNLNDAGNQEQHLLVAYIVGEAGRKLDSDDFRSVARSFLPDYMLPNQFIFVDSIPLNHNGKVDREQLPKPVWNLQDEAEQQCVLPRSDSEHKLASIWSALLKMESLSITGNFFELGGHSLLATELINLINEGFSLELPLKSIFEFPTVEKLAAYIDTLQWMQQEQEVPQGDDREELEI